MADDTRLMIEMMARGVEGVRQEMHALRVDLLAHTRDVGDIRAQTLLTAGEVVSVRADMAEFKQEVEDRLDLMNERLDRLPIEKWDQTAAHVGMVRGWVTSSPRRFFAVAASAMVLFGGSWATVAHLIDAATK